MGVYRRGWHTLVEFGSMASIRPFLGLRYASDCGPLDGLTAPPYDVLSSEQRDQYAARNNHNVVHLTLPEQKEDDRSKYVKYLRSSALLTEWRKSGALELESSPAFYRYIQHFTIPGSPVPLVRTSIITLIKVEPYENGVVLPHEQTFPKHKEDRMRILEATRSHLECIFGLFDDPSGDVLKAIIDAPSTESLETHSDDGVTHFLEPITDQESIQTIKDLIKDKKVWIADGHHRYETALAYRQGKGASDELIPEDYLMMALCSISDPGLVLLPTHRMVKTLPLGVEESVAQLSTVFNLVETAGSDLMSAIEDSASKGVPAFGVLFKGGQGFVLTEKNPGEIKGLIATSDSDFLKDLDVTVLHQVILSKLLQVKGLDSIAYTRDAQEAVDAVQGDIEASFLMNPPSVEDMKVIALGGEKMPQKSTYYFPKILSGLVIWSLNDF